MLKAKLTPQFRIRTVMAIIVLIALPIAWYGNSKRHLSMERALIGEIENRNSRYTSLEVLHSGRPSIFCGTGVAGILQKEPATIVDRLGAIFAPDLFERVTTVSLTGLKFEDESILKIAKFPFLKKVTCDKRICSDNAWDQFVLTRPDVAIEYYTDPLIDIFKEAEDGSVDPFSTGQE